MSLEGEENKEIKKCPATREKPCFFQSECFKGLTSFCKFSKNPNKYFSIKIKK